MLYASIEHSGYVVHRVILVLVFRGPGNDVFRGPIAALAVSVVR